MNSKNAYKKAQRVFSAFKNANNPIIQGKRTPLYTPYYDEFSKEKYLEYYWELADYLRCISDIKYFDYQFDGYYFDTATNTTEEMYYMQIFEDNSINFNYDNRCVNNLSPRFKLKDVFKICKTKGDALKILQYCMKCFSIAANK